jgi:two-component system, OmpR family, response regulator
MRSRSFEAGLRVLVVDDDCQQLAMVERSLRLHGFEVATSAEPIGVSTLAMEFEPDVVLFDVNIPALSGDRLLSIVRRHTPARTRMVLFSACDVSTLRRLALDVKADGWITKSVEGTELARELRKIWEKGK